MKFFAIANRYFLCCAAVAMLAQMQSTLVFAATDANDSDSMNDLARLSLEELGNIIVTSVSKKPEPLSDAPTSIYVITRDDIRRSGANSLPEALRLAPNLSIAQFSASGYAISARGFNSNSANKLLVLIDGRSVYSPLFHGVFWDVQDVMLEDIERIEVISGPGGTLWGVNAVNGVINVITRSSKDTQGGLIATGASSQETDTSLRYGGATESGTNFRVYAKTFDRNHTVTANDSPVNDGWHQSQVGFRADWAQPADSVAIQGNAYRGVEAQPAPGEIQVAGVTIPIGNVLTSGENLSANWTHRLEGGANINVLTYLDRVERNVIPTFFDTQDTFDLQVLYSLPPMGTHTINLGAEYRYGIDTVVNSQYIAFLPATLHQTWSSLFAQDQWALRDNLQLTAGARIERNDYTGSEFLPNLRLAWKFDPNYLLWTALSRTVVAPSRLDHDTYLPGSPPYLLAGGPNYISEVARVLEIGFRGQAEANLSYSATVFHALYDHLKSAEIPPGSASVIFANGMAGSTSGIEMWGNYRITNTWRTSAGFTALREFVHLYPSSITQFPQVSVDNDPAHTFILQSALDLPHQTTLDVTLRHVTALSNPLVPAYSTLAGRFGWKPMKNLELSATAQNLIGSGHGEFIDVVHRAELRRSIFFKAVANF
jgi:iron complex outermembrane receptor protein